METTDFTEFDLVSIGNEAALNANCTIQTHLFEDRVMKMSTIHIGPRACVGAGTLVLYDTALGEGAALGDLSLLMKGETLPPWTKWEGIPAQPAPANSP
jgi:non-ribosomal peptide synthetase-like protein